MNANEAASNLLPRDNIFFHEVTFTAYTTLFNII